MIRNCATWKVLMRSSVVIFACDPNADLYTADDQRTNSRAALQRRYGPQGKRAIPTDAALTVILLISALIHL